MKYNMRRVWNRIPLKVVNTPPAGANPELEDLALTNGREYRYEVEAVDTRGNKSALMTIVSGMPQPGPEWAP